MSVPRALLTLRGAVDLMGKENARLRTKNRELRAKVKELEAALDTLDRHIEREKAKDAKEGDEK